MSRSSFSDDRSNRAPQHGQLHLQLLDVQRLGMDLGIARRNVDVLAREFGLQPCGEQSQRF